MDKTEQTQPTAQEVGEDYSLFDTRNFVSSSPLNGKRGTILPGSAFVRRSWKENDPGAEVRTYLVYRVASDVYAKFGGVKTILLGCGKHAWPATLENGKLVRQESGPLLGGQVDRKSGAAMFIAALKSAGFPGVAGAKGITAADCADFTWKCITKNYGGSIGEKDYDMPSEFHGYVEASTLPSVQADDDFTFPQDASPTGNGHANDAEVTAEAIKTIQAIVAANPDGVARGQMGIKSAPLLATNPNRVAIQAKMLSDETYRLAGVKFNAQTVGPAQV